MFIQGVRYLNQASPNGLHLLRCRDSALRLDQTSHYLRWIVYYRRCIDDTYRRCIFSHSRRTGPACRRVLMSKALWLGWLDSSILFGKYTETHAVGTWERLDVERQGGSNKLREQAGHRWVESLKHWVGAIDISRSFCGEFTSAPVVIDLQCLPACSHGGPGMLVLDSGHASRHGAVDLIMVMNRRGLAIVPWVKLV